MPIKTGKLMEEKELLSCRNVLWCLVFSGFGVHAILEANINLTIIAMVAPRPIAAIAVQCVDDIQLTSNRSNVWLNASSQTNFEEPGTLEQSSFSSLELVARRENTTPLVPVQYPDRVAWNEYEQGLALGGVFWAHWVTQLPGGILARHYGTKLIFGLSNLVTALLGFLLPFCARYHLYAFLSVRVVQGLCTGFAWPSMHAMTAKWIPLDERSKFISAYLGSSVGGAITLPIFAMFINWFGWASVFYGTSTLGVIWYVAWYFLVYDTPQEHPRISEAEKTHISQNLESSVNHFTSRPVPWKAILTSGHLWLTTLALCGNTCGFFTVSVESPSYFNYMHGWNIGATSLLAAAPQIIRMIFSYVFSSLADWIIRTKKMSTSNLRKFATFVSNGMQAFMILGLAVSGCHPNLAIVFIILGTAATGSITAGTLASFIDLSPNYASILYGIANTVSLCTVGLIPPIVGILTNNNQTIERWRLVFLITAAIVCLTGIPFMFYGTSNLQPWNDVEIDEKCNEELQKLRPNVDRVKQDKAIDVIAECKNDTPLT